MRHAIDSHIAYKVCVYCAKCIHTHTHTHRPAYVYQTIATNRLHFVWPDVHSFDEATKKFKLHNLADTDLQRKMSYVRPPLLTFPPFPPLLERDLPPTFLTNSPIPHRSGSNKRIIPSFCLLQELLHYK